MVSKIVDDKRVKPIAFEEMKSNSDSSMLMFANQRIRNPLQRKQGGQDRSRKAYYSLMLQKVMRIMRDEELYLEQTLQEREKHKQELDAYRMSISKPTKN